jgi:hypothetical protein
MGQMNAGYAEHISVQTHLPSVSPSSSYFKSRSAALRAGSWGTASIRRYVSLREPHLRLCTFASPRRVPSGHGAFSGPAPTGRNPDRKKFRVMGWVWSGNRRLRRWGRLVYGMGMLRIPQICCTLGGAEERGVCPLGTGPFRGQHPRACIFASPRRGLSGHGAFSRAAV